MAPPGPPLSEDDTAAAQTLAASMHGGRRGHGCKVGVHFDLRKVGSDAFDAGPCDLLTVVQLDALQTVAALEVLQRDVSDERAVVELHHSEALLATGAAAESSDAVICDQLAVGEGQCLQARAVDRQLNQGVICHQNTFFQVHFFKLMTVSC